MTLLKINESQKRALLIASVIGAIVSIWFLKHYLMLIVFAAIMAYLFNPVNEWLKRHGRGPGQAAALTFLVSMLAIIIPVLLIGLITVLQIERLAHDLSSGNYSIDIGQLGTNAINSANGFLESIGASYRVSVEQLSNTVSSAAESFGQSIVEGLLSSLSGFFAFITTVIIYIYVFMSMVRHQDKIVETLKKLNPLGEMASVVYLEKVGAMTKATVRGQFIIAFLQGTESALVLSIAGLSDLFFFFVMLLTVLSVIPLGAGVVTIPIGIVMILTGNIWQGVLVIANHLLIVTNIDNVMRPKLVPPRARLDPALMILAVFSGLIYFGFLGVVIGPVIMIVLLTTLQMFLEVHRETEALDESRPKKGHGLFKRVRQLGR